MPERVWRYAIPHELAERHRIRRFGFHGIFYRAVLDRYCAITGTPKERATIVAQPTYPRATIAVEIFCYRIRKYVGACLAALGGAQAIVFAGAIGERSPEVRARSCQGLEWLGLTLDPRANGAAADGERRISAPGSRIEAFVTPTDEELYITRDTVKALGGQE